MKTIKHQFPVHKLISGGQTGVDRAALDIAISLGIPHGGWCPKGRRAEDGVISDKYDLKETPTENYQERTEWNVKDADATLVLVVGEPAGGTLYTTEMCKKHAKPYLVYQLQEKPADLRKVLGWINEHKINILNIAGPRALEVEEIYDKASNFLIQLFSARS